MTRWLSLWHKSASDRWYILCFKDWSKTFNILLWPKKKKKLLSKSFFTQTHLERRTHKSWHYFILFCASIKELRYDTATKSWWLWNRETWQHFISFMLWLYILEKLVSLPVQLEIDKSSRIQQLGKELSYCLVSSTTVGRNPLEEME